MFNIIRHWFNRYFSDPEAVLLFVLLVIGFGVIITMGNILAPVLASIIIAYFLQWWGQCNPVVSNFKSKFNSFINLQAPTLPANN